MRNSCIRSLFIAIAGVIAIASSGSVSLADPFIGDWEGQWAKDVTEKDPMIVAQVIPRGAMQYQINVIAEFDQRAEPYAVIQAEADGDSIRFEQEGWTGLIQGDRFTGEGQYKNAHGRFEMQKVIRLSPTLGKKASRKAVVLFDGDNFDEWEATGRQAGGQIKWQLNDGAMCIVAGERADRHSLVSKRRFTDCRLHIEFRSPLEPTDLGQARGNSGVFVQGYEVQILDSYGLPGYYNECGALYKVAAPMVNMCAPPLQWQTFDITYHGPKFDEQGEKVANARMTVFHNGKLIHKNQDIRHHTSNVQSGRDAPEPREPGPIQLQNHGDEVQFRNIWVIDLSDRETASVLQSDFGGRNGRTNAGRLRNQ